MMLRPRIGNDPGGKPIVALEVLPNGAINYTDGKILRNAQTAEKQKYLAKKGQWVILEGQLHYATGRFPQCRWRNAEGGRGRVLTDRTACQLTLRTLGSGKEHARKVSIDNIELKIIEP